MDNDLIEVKVLDAEPDFASGQFKIILKDHKTNRILSIWVGPFEGHAITLGLEEAWLPRPMTHDLTIDLINHLNARIEKVVITDLKDNTFFAVINLTSGGQKISVDSRPSDAIAIAVRLKIPIFVSSKLSDVMSDELDEIFEKLQPKGTVH